MNALFSPLLNMPFVTIGMLDWLRVLKQFRKLDSSIEEVEIENHVLGGTVTWGSEFESDLIFVRWQWREVGPNIPALANPLAISSNLQLRDEGGEDLLSTHQMLYLNQAVHRLPWQQEFMRLRPVPELAA